MRSEEVNGVVVEYPDAVSFCFNTMPVNIKGWSGNVQMEIINLRTDKMLSEKRVTHGGYGFFDLSYYARSLFDVDSINTIDYSSTGDAGTMVEFTVHIKFFNGNTQENLFTFDTFVVWGALGIGETFDTMRNMKWYRNLPFTFSIYYPKETNNLVEMYMDGEHVNAFYADRKIQNVSTVSTYDHSKVQFKLNEEYMITFEPDDCTEGVYLRWLDRQGFFRYWLFKYGDMEHEVKDELDVMRNNMQGYELTDGINSGTGRRISKTANRALPVCAPLVDSDTFDMLLHLVTSPFVDMYIGTVDDVPQWVGVNVKAETVKKTRSTLQDFEAVIILPETKVQRL